MLPDFLVPYKHYSEETITGALDDIVTSSDIDSEDYPSEITIARWHHWFFFNQLCMEGQLRSVGHRELGFGEELLKSGISLLSHIRSSIPEGWLRIILRFIYNSGNSLAAFY
jgi:hypothetical protein